MAYPIPHTAQLVADLFVAIDQEDAPATFAAARALAARIGDAAALALARAFLADRRGTPAIETIPISEPSHIPVSCA